MSVVFLSHDNALSHKARIMTSFLKEQGDYFLERQPYSPDIASFDHFAFPRRKKNVFGRNYTSCQKLGAATFDLFRSIPPKKTIRKPSRIG